MHKHEQTPKKFNFNCSISAGARHAPTTHDKMGPSGPMDSQGAQRLVERGVLLPDGQEVHVQVAQQAVVCESELGKRKLDDAFQRVELREREVRLRELEVRCEAQAIDNISQKMSLVGKFTAAMSACEPDWRPEKQLVLQMQEFVKNARFGDAGAGSVAVAAPPARAAISISQVAMQMGQELTQGQALAIGKLVSKSYKSVYKRVPRKNSQSVDGAQRSVNRYTEEHRGLIAAAVRSCLHCNQ